MKNIITLFLLGITCCSYGQRLKGNAAFIELGGNSIFISVNYEKTFKRQILARIGFSPAPYGVFVPVSMGKSFFKGSHHIEASGGATYGYYWDGYFSENRQKEQLFVTGFVGYRFDKPRNRFLCRAGYTPMFRATDRESFGRYYGNVGLSFGFKW
jgi:hypothetical protein